MTREEAAELEEWRRYRQIFVVANEGLALLIAEGPDAGSPEELDDWHEQIRGNQRCIDYIDIMLRTGRPLPLSDLPDVVLDPA